MEVMDQYGREENREIEIVRGGRERIGNTTKENVRDRQPAGVWKSERDEKILRIFQRVGSRRMRWGIRERKKTGSEIVIVPDPAQPLYSWSGNALCNYAGLLVALLLPTTRYSPHTRLSRQHNSFSSTFLNMIYQYQLPLLLFSFLCQ